MFRGNNSQNLFFEDDDRTQFCNYLSETSEFYSCKIHLFCLMTNHVHLVIEVGYIPLSKIMQTIASRYARFINQKYNRKGHLYESRFNSIVIQDEKYLLELCYYIHMNPRKAGIVHDIDEYKWSSHQTYSGNQTFPWVTTELVLEILIKNIDSENNHYFHFIQDRKDKYKTPSLCRIDANGDLTICDAIHKYNSNFTQQNKLINFPINRIITIICNVMQIPPEKITTNTLERKFVLARSMITYFAHYHAGYLLTDIAIILAKNVDNLSKTTHKMLKKARSNDELRKLTEFLERKLHEELIQTNVNQ